MNGKFILGRIGLRTLNLNDVPWQDPIDDKPYFYVFYCGFPVVPGHMLFVPKYDCAKAIDETFSAAWGRGHQLMSIGAIDGFNVGMNNGAAAGQTIDWPHIHLIPRLTGDTPDPTGGVRNVIPNQGNYKGNTYNQPAPNHAIESAIAHHIAESRSNKDDTGGDWDSTQSTSECDFGPDDTYNPS